MGPMAIILVSTVFTGSIVYAVFHFTNKKKKTISSHNKGFKEIIDLPVDEEFLDEVESKFEGMVYQALEKVNKEGPENLHPRLSCFANPEVYRTCKRNCLDHMECGSTVTILKDI